MARTTDDSLRRFSNLANWPANGWVSLTQSCGRWAVKPILHGMFLFSQLCVWLLWSQLQAWTKGSSSLFNPLQKRDERESLLLLWVQRLPSHLSALHSRAPAWEADLRVSDNFSLGAIEGPQKWWTFLVNIQLYFCHYFRQFIEANFSYIYSHYYKFLVNKVFI